MSEITDIADTEALTHQISAIKTARNSLAQNNITDNCLDCEEEIPQERRDALPGCLRCKTCQTEYEKEISVRQRISRIEEDREEEF